MAVVVYFTGLLDFAVTVVEDIAVVVEDVEGVAAGVESAAAEYDRAVVLVFFADFVVEAAA